MVSGLQSWWTKITRGPDILRFWLAFLLNVTVGALYFAFLTPGLYLSEVVGRGWVTAFTVFFFFVWVHSLTMHLVVSQSDPGFIPKRDFVQEPLVLFRIVEVRGHEEKMKWCSTCHIWRPLRCSHCRSCDQCVHRFDHHCPFVGNCIGLQNYRTFIIFLFDACLASTFATIIPIFFLARVSSGYDGFSSAFSHFGVWMTGSIILSILSGFSFLNLSFLFLYHISLISCAKTTSEGQTNIFDTTSFSRGCLHNFFDILCGPHYPIFSKSVNNGEDVV
eukprot:TRINITY_DN11445_c0_g1_i1.p1 TRINITY_DN11445_c0_g1~~TRINITY_DN11445_c0_g1_i1.p1  ORF type:complete len:276 (-),score=4.17 TRINITY_DN11445_c0_g1_i1:45-872(-)